MNIVLYLVGILSILWGAFISLLAKGAIHEIQAYVMFLIGAVLIVGGGVIGAVNRLRERMQDEARATRSELESARPVRALADSASVVNAPIPPRPPPR